MAEAHKISAHQYDKLLSSVEFSSTTIYLFPKQTGDKNINDIVKDKILDVEKKNQRNQRNKPILNTKSHKK